MKGILKIEQLTNGAHQNQIGQIKNIPDGWAVIPKNMECKNFPFGTIEVAEVDGVMTVIKWTAGEMPEPEPETEELTPSAQDDTDAMLIDHEYRLTLLELGLTE